MSFAVMAFDQITGKMFVAGVIVASTAFLAYTRRGPPKQCQICGGMGAWKCVICDGKGFMFNGRVKSKCKACVGRGKRLCRECTGSGWDKRTNYIG